MKLLFAPRLGLLVLASVLAWARPAEARPEGIAAQGCFGCHRGGQVPTVTLTANPPNPAMGQAVTLTVSISTANGPTAGFYLRSSGKGTFNQIAGEGTRMNGDGVTHSAVKRANGATTTFQVGWTAPATAGGVSFDVWALSGNGGGGAAGDGGGEAYLTFTYGCTGTSFYPDGDSDGYGSKVLPAIRECTKPPFRVEDNTDCNDYESKIHPGLPDICNGKDDNCNGQIDENLPMMTVYEDKDGDGVGVAGGATMMFCGATKGFGVGTNDCNDNDPMISPTVTEMCNGRDDNCNQRVDEEAKVYCGTGWCRRAGEGCGTTICTPGKPRKELCNAFDDDCDGVVDNGTSTELCGAGSFCQEGYCVEGTGPARPDGGFPVIDEDGGVIVGTGSGGSGGPGIADSGGGCSVGPTATAASMTGLGGLVGLLLLLAGWRQRPRRR